MERTDPSTETRHYEEAPAEAGGPASPGAHRDRAAVADVEVGRRGPVIFRYGEAVPAGIRLPAAPPAGIAIGRGRISVTGGRGGV